MQGQKSLTLCWRLFLGLCKCCHHHCSIERRPIVWLWRTVTTQPTGYFMTQCQSSLMFRWRWFLGCGNDRVICVFRNNADLYIHFGRMGQCNQLIAGCVRFKIVDTLLTHTLITVSKQPLYTQLVYATNYIHIFDIQYCVCMYYRLHPGVLLPPTFWSTAIYAIWVWNGVALSHCRAFGRQLTACRSFH